MEVAGLGNFSASQKSTAETSEGSKDARAKATSNEVQGTSYGRSTGQPDPSGESSF